MKNKKKFIKASALTLALVGTILGTTLTSCNSYNSSNDKNDISIEENIEINQNKTQKGQNVSKKEITDISQIKPTYVQRRWAGEQYLTIDEESLRQIIGLAMDNARDFYLSIGSNPMKKNTSDNKKTPEELFYIDWMNDDFFMARAKMESSDIYMVNYRANISQNQMNDPSGIMQINTNSTKKTLEQYYRDTYKQNIDLSDLKTFPDANDVANVQTSKDAQKRITETIYNNVYLSICYDLWQAKCLNSGHTNYYAPYGGYTEQLRQKATIAGYLHGFNTVVESLKNGTFEKEFGHSKYVTNILKFQQEFMENQNEQQNQPGN